MFRKPTVICTAVTILIAVFALGGIATTAAAEIPVYVDIKPLQCPNPLSVSASELVTTASTGVPMIVVAVMGTETFNVHDIDPTTILLEGVAPERWGYEDISRPVEDASGECDCTIEGPDGLIDLSLKFTRANIVGILGDDVGHGDEVILTLTGSLTETLEPIVGHDCMVVYVTKRRTSQPCPSSEELDTDPSLASEVPVYVDIKPLQCPNPLNVSASELATTASIGIPLIAVAVMGTETFNVHDIDPTTILLEGVAPVRWGFEDVSQPIERAPGECDCTIEGPDGFIDLSLKFTRADIVGVLGEDVGHGDDVIFALTGNLTETGIPIVGHDCMAIRVTKRRTSSPCPAGKSMEGRAILSVANFPNPFNAATLISYELSDAGPVSIVVYNILGQNVRTLVNGERSAGTHTETWDGTDNSGRTVSSGMYFYRVQAGGEVVTRKMSLLK
ncbi:MAG TPA: T9SS type A sorting domain-containing protein [Acidobacteriota bacterium]|nr:T9SS type A sorting domain-containing protein [Acidobacteriota bacterium]